MRIRLAKKIVKNWPRYRLARVFAAAVRVGGRESVGRIAALGFCAKVILARLGG